MHLVVRADVNSKVYLNVLELIENARVFHLPKSFCVKSIIRFIVLLCSNLQKTESKFLSHLLYHLTRAKITYSKRLQPFKLTQCCQFYLLKIKTLGYPCCCFFSRRKSFIHLFRKFDQNIRKNNNQSCKWILLLQYSFNTRHTT